MNLRLLPATTQLTYESEIIAAILAVVVSGDTALATTIQRRLKADLVFHFALHHDWHDHEFTIVHQEGGELT
jgi:hypothetical protein